MIRVAIVEDEKNNTEQVEQYLKKYQEENGVVFKITSFVDGLDIAEKYSGEYDVIFLDIQMKHMNGFETAKRIRECDGKVIIVFITNYLQYAVRGYAVDALDYMVKPINYFKFSHVLKRAIDKLSDSDKDLKYVSLNTADGVCKVALKKIYFVESQEHLLNYVTEQGTFTVRGRLSDCIKALEPFGFYQVQKSYVVNLNNVEKIKGETCVVFGTEIAISRSKKKDFLNAMLKHMVEVE